MPLPISKMALDRLGAELIETDDISDDLLTRLAEVLEAYQSVLDVVKSRLLSLGFQAHTRVKTTTTLTEKLRRERGMRLSRMQDLAGARITVSNRIEQDEAAKTICTHFEAAGCLSRVVDRRANPSHGYRAVHVVVQADGIPVEIQVRTRLQDSWAQIVERLADRWGRGIRYGQDPIEPDRRVITGGSVFTRRETIEMLLALSDVIDATEGAQAAATRGGGLAERLRISIEDRRGTGPDPDLAESEDRLEQQEAETQEYAEKQSVQQERVRAILQEVASARDEEDDFCR